MARTRTEIKTLVNYNTGRGTEKASLIELLCDEALKVALAEHPFKDARSYNQDFVLTEATTSVSISTISNLEHVITATIIETSGDKNQEIELKNEVWWTKNVINAEDNTQGWPAYALRRGSTILFDRPVDSNLTLRLVVTTKQSFATDATACPIAIADLFVTQYVTSMVFLSVNETEKYQEWYKLAMGVQYAINGKVGGTLGAIIDQDKRDIAESSKMQRSTVAEVQSSVAIQNLISGHEDYGNVRRWA